MQATRVRGVKKIFLVPLQHFKNIFARAVFIFFENVENDVSQNANICIKYLYKNFNIFWLSFITMC